MARQSDFNTLVFYLLAFACLKNKLIEKQHVSKRVCIASNCTVMIYTSAFRCEIP